LPEADPLISFRASIPTLVVGGRYDFVFPLETSMGPMFRLLGRRERQAAALWEGGVAQRQIVIRRHSIGSTGISGRSSSATDALHAL
jgi:hypothetical protein